MKSLPRPNLRTCCLISMIFISAFLSSCKKNAVGKKTATIDRIDTNKQTNVSPPSAGLILNPGFETDPPVSKPTGWSASGAVAASYTQKGGHSGKNNLAHYSASAYAVYTYQTISDLTNGTYSLTAWVENSGGQNFCYLNAKNYGGGPERMTSLPISGKWVQVIIRGILVSNGTVTIGLNSDALAGNWAKIDDVTLTKDAITYDFLKGGDISELDYVESKGGTYADSGHIEDCLHILKNNGINIVRLRLYNDPGNPAYSPSNLLPAGFQNSTDILKLARRAKAAGMKILLSFHYSDYWTNPGTQNKPHDWTNLSFADLKTAVYNFTYNFMSRMKAQGTTPEYVSLGNETSDGFLFPDGQANNISQMTQLFNEGYNAVKAVASTSQCIIHLNDAGNSGLYDWYFPAFIAAGGKFDIIGASYYPYWTGRTVSQIQAWANAETAKYGKPILLMETAINWSATLPGGAAGQLADNGPYNPVYPQTPEGQKDFLYECFNGLKGAAGGGIIGDIYWDPIMIAAPGVGWELGQPNVVSNSALFDFTGHSLAAFKAFKYNN